MDQDLLLVEEQSEDAVTAQFELPPGTQYFVFGQYSVVDHIEADSVEGTSPVVVVRAVVNMTTHETAEQAQAHLGKIRLQYNADLETRNADNLVVRVFRGQELQIQAQFRGEE